MEQVATAAGACTMLGAPKGYHSALAVAASGTDLALVPEAALALEEELAADLASAVELVVASASVVELALVVAMGALDSPCAPLEASKRSPLTRTSSPP